MMSQCRWALGLLCYLQIAARCVQLEEVSEDYDHQANRPVVKVIKDGYVSCHDDGACERSSSVVYIYDGPECQIIVDTGVPKDIRSILRGLSENDALPTAITLVITSHLHPDHVGNLNLFSYASYLFPNDTLTGDVFKQLPPPSLEKAAGDGDYEARLVCPNVGVVRVRGHTADDTVVLVHNASEYGNVSVTGDIFISVEDIHNGTMWRASSMYPDDQQRARKIIIADSDYIIPGHGGGFRVTEDMRQAVYEEEQSGCWCSPTSSPSSVYTTTGPPSAASNSQSGSLQGDSLLLPGNISDQAGPAFNLSSHPALLNFTVEEPQNNSSPNVSSAGQNHSSPSLPQPVLQNEGNKSAGPPVADRNASPAFPKSNGSTNGNASAAGSQPMVMSPFNVSHEGHTGEH